MGTNEQDEIIFECSGASKVFDGTRALSDVHLSIARGEVHALLGENDAGKSILMKCVIGLYKADSGVMTFEGKLTTFMEDLALAQGQMWATPGLNTEKCCHLCSTENSN
jgi:ABC-type sugar transport system ATPase subunit